MLAMCKSSVPVNVKGFSFRSYEIHPSQINGYKQMVIIRKTQCEKLQCREFIYHQSTLSLKYHLQAKHSADAATSVIQQTMLDIARNRPIEN